MEDFARLPGMTRKCPEFPTFRSHEEGSADQLKQCLDEEGTAGRMDRTLLALLLELAVDVPELAEVQALRVWLYRPEKNLKNRQLLGIGLPAKVRQGMERPLDNKIASWVWRHHRPVIVSAGADARFPEFAGLLLDWDIKFFCAIPLMLANQPMGILGLASTRRDLLAKFDLDLASRGLTNGDFGIKNHGDAERKEAANEDTPMATADLAVNTASQENFEGIIGRSSAIGSLCSQIKVVAPTHSTVLILGETGTGKELIAQAIHNLSPRHDRPFVKVNCAAIPAGLIESELFGHERGAFTGAVERRIGRFEMAHGGTLLLDEIGDIPPELQPKLLRVLQQQEFERLGSTRTTQVNVRVVAATSRDLPKMVNAREFRADLYYRLNVFPLRVPALRERQDDIILLAKHFVEFYAKRMNKTVREITPETKNVLSRYCWPGNVRELQNVIERAVILSQGSVLHLPLEDLRPPCHTVDGRKPDDWTTLKELEREHILQALAASNWVLGGPMGAGARLGLARTTLIAKMHKLRIFRAPPQALG